MRGYWPSFPVSPEEDYVLFADLVDAERRSFRLATELEAIADEEHEERLGDPASQLALWRAVLSAGVEAFLGGLRDSDGAVGSFLGAAIETYGRLPWRDTGIHPGVLGRPLRVVHLGRLGHPAPPRHCPVPRRPEG